MVWPTVGSRTAKEQNSDVISMPADFRRHLVGKTSVNVFQCDIAEIRFVGELVIKRRFSLTNG